MAQRSWGKAFLKLFKKEDPTAEVETPERYVELARRCMKNVDRSFSRTPSSSLQLHHSRCEYLANKLREALSEAETSSAYPSSSKIDVQGVEIMKLLWRCAREVESFIEDSHRNNWVQAAIVSANMTEYVCQLSADLKLCMLLISNYLKYTWRPAPREYENSTVSAAVKMIASYDQTALLTILEKVSTSSHSSNEESQLAQCLASRLSQQLSGSVDLDCWKIQFSSLFAGQRLGSGSAGVTVRKSKWMGEDVAEKVFQGADHASFRNEVQILAGLAHPNIVPFIGYAEDGNRSVIVMELMDGDLSSLMEDRLRQNPTAKVPFSVSEAVDMMLQTAEGMRYLHEKRVVHRDLKALNILVKRRKGMSGEDVVYAAKVADFGLSKTRESSSSYSCLTANIGTRRWMAPELLPPGEDDLGARTSNLDLELNYPFKVDVYSFGMVCYEILTGQVPFSSISSPKEVTKMVLKGERPELPERCPELLKDLIHSCWDTDPTCRPCFEEICRRLRRLKFLMILDSRIANIGAHGGFRLISKPGYYVDPGTLELRIHFGYEHFPKWKYKISEIELPQVGQSFSKGFVTFEVMSKRGVKVAVKRIEKNQLIDDPQGVEDVKREVKIMRRLGSEFESIVEFYEAYEDDDHVYIVMEICEGGSLSDRIKHKGYYPEHDAVKIVKQMLNAVEGCHMRDVVHHDMQPENFLFKSLAEDSSLKATGFHFSYEHHHKMRGSKSPEMARMTTAYMGPEVLKGEYGPESDMWGIGVITYILLCGFHPFGNSKRVILWNKRWGYKPDFHEKPWPSISRSAKDFVTRLLVVSCSSRATATEALSHPWVSSNGNYVLHGGRWKDPAELQEPQRQSRPRRQSRPQVWKDPAEWQEPRTRGWKSKDPQVMVEDDDEASESQRPEEPAVELKEFFDESLTELWKRVVREVTSTSLKNLLQTHGRLVAAGVAIDGSYAVVQLEFDSAHYCHKAERSWRSICIAFQAVLSTAVEVRIALSDLYPIGLD